MKSRAGAVIGLGVLLCGAAAAETPAEIYARAKAIHDRVLTIDTHVDIPFTFASDAYDMALVTAAAESGADRAPARASLACAFHGPKAFDSKQSFLAASARGTDGSRKTAAEAARRRPRVRRRVLNTIIHPSRFRGAPA